MTVIIINLSFKFNFEIITIVASYWLVHAFFSCFLLPHYFKISNVTIFHNEIIHISGFIGEKREYMPMNAVKSITLIITPFGQITGLNFVIVNALGSKMLLPFMRKNDCEDIEKYINSIIRSRV